MTAHLALTGLREFWPDDVPVWLVSPSCVPVPALDSDQLARLVAGVIPHPWRHSNLPEVHRELRGVYEATLAFLGDRLNALHGTRRSERYWRLMVGPWLHGYTNLLAHHHQSLCNAGSRLGSFETIGLDQQHFVTPDSTLDFIYEATDDLYNLQLYTRFARLHGVAIVEARSPASSRRMAGTDNPENLPRRRTSLPSRLAGRARRDVVRVMQRVMAPRVRTLLRRSYLPAGFEWRLAVATAGRVWPHEGPQFVPRRALVSDAASRGGLRGFGGVPGILAEYLSQFLADDVPRVFVEEYPRLVEFAEAAYAGFRPRVVLSTAAWHDDHAFSHFAGMRAEAGAQLVGGQHGGNFGIVANFQDEAFERTLTDHYLTWGWSDAADPRCIPTAANRLVNARKRTRPIGGDGILYVGTSILRFPSSAAPDASGYPELQRRFFAAAPGIRRITRVRPHGSDFGWQTVKRLRATYPDIAIESWEVPFRESLARARLYVCDHISTTFAEVLATNTPMVMFWDPEFTDIRPSARTVFARARDAGIVHDSPESAARWAERVYPDVDGWWFDAPTQVAVNEFRDHFARTSAAAFSEWRALLDRLAQ